MKNTLIISLMLLMNYCVHGQAFTWMQKTPMPLPSGTYSAVSFTINDLIYVAGGCNEGLDSNYASLWQYDPATDAWIQMADMPDGGTYGSSAFVIGGEGYVFTGWHRVVGSNPIPTDFSYKYNPVSNTWIDVQAFPINRYTCVAFELNGKGYLGTGYSPLTNDWWEYDTTTDSWTQMASMPGTVRQASHGFVLNGFGYVCMGGQYQVNYSDMWQYDATANSWTQKANYPDTARSSGSTFVLNGKAYLVGGSNYQGTPFASIYSYDPNVDQWTFVEYFPGGPRLQMITATANGKVYMGQGSYTPQVTFDYLTANDWWECSIADANTISGKLFIDFNNNFTQDAVDPSMGNRLVSETTSGRFTFSRADGSYDLYVPGSGNFIITTDSFGYYSPVPSSHAISFAGINETDSLNDFAFQASTTINDLCVSISPLGNFRAGMDGSYVINYENSGTTILTPIITFFNDTNVVYVTSSVTPTVIATDSVVWDQLPALSPFQSGSLTVTVNVNQTVPIGTELDVSVRVDPITDDNNPLCNIAYWKQETTGSYDPNDILVNRKNIFVAELASQPYLDYTINFQNTGNDTAFNVDIINPFPPTLDLTSVEFVTSSHPVVLRYIADYHSLGFKFNNILLPDSNINEALSHGFIHYRAIPLTSLNIGDVIENSAAIYFDFNAPVLTNTVTTIVIDPLGVPLVNGSQQDVIMYPNPTNGDFKIKIKSNATEESLVEVYDLIGKKIISEKISLHDGINNLRFANYNLRTGIYLLKIKLKGKEFTQKLNIVK